MPRIYAIHDTTAPGGTPPVLVEANHPAIAIRAVVGQRYTAKVASQAELVRALKGGQAIVNAIRLQGELPATEG